MAYYNLEPWGYYADNKRAGMIAATLANIAARGTARTFKWSDFFPATVTAPAREQTIDEQIAVMKAISDGQCSNSHS